MPRRGRRRLRLCTWFFRASTTSPLTCFPLSLFTFVRSDLHILFFASFPSVRPLSPAASSFLATTLSPTTTTTTGSRLCFLLLLLLCRTGPARDRDGCYFYSSTTSSHTFGQTEPCRRRKRTSRQYGDAHVDSPGSRPDISGQLFPSYPPASESHNSGTTESPAPLQGTVSLFSGLRVVKFYTRDRTFSISGETCYSLPSRLPV